MVVINKQASFIVCGKQLFTSGVGDAVGLVVGASVGRRVGVRVGLWVGV